MAKAKSQNQPSTNSALGFEVRLWADTGQRAELALPSAAEIIGNFGGADQRRNAVNYLQSLPYSTVPVAEQTRFVVEVGRRLCVVEVLAAVVSTSFDKSRDSVLQRAPRLRQSILQKVFKGEIAC